MNVLLPNVTTVIAFTVNGKATTKGSMKSIRRGQRIVLVENTQNSKSWRAEVAWAARLELKGRSASELPVAVIIHVFLPRPKSNKSPVPIGRGTGDVDKLARNILDALTDAGVYKDDAQVTWLSIEKTWATDGDEPHVNVSVYERKLTELEGK